jgi:ribosomal protein S18 acetylase RimI-like enzyme
MSLTFEPFNIQTDTEEYVNLLDANLRVIRGEFVQFFRRTIGREGRQFAQLLKKSKLLTIKVNGEVAGFIVYIVSKDRSTVFIEHFHLKPLFRGQGVGTRTLQFVEAQAKELGCTKLELEVYASNPALRLYKRFGFKRIGFFHGVCLWIYKMRKVLDKN